MKSHTPVNTFEHTRAPRSRPIGRDAADNGIDLLVGLVADVLGVPIALLSLVDSDGRWCQAEPGLELGGLATDDAFSEQVVREGLACLVVDTTSDERLSTHPLVVGAPHLRFYAGFPLRTAQGFVFGALCVFDTRPRSPSPQELATMEALCQYASDLLPFQRDARLAAEHARLLGAAVTTATDTVVILDERGRIEYVNPAGERDFGHTEAAFKAMHIDALISGEPATPGDQLSSGDRTAWLRTVVGGPRPLQAIHRDGSMFPIEAVFTEVTIDSRTVFTGFLRHAQARPTEGRSLNEAEALRVRHEQHLSALDVMGIGVLTIGATGEVTFINASGLRVSGKRAVDVIGASWESALELDDTVRSVVLAQRAQPQSDRTRIVVHLGRADQGSKSVEVDLRDDPLDPTRHILFLHDVSAVRPAKGSPARQRSDTMLGDSVALHELLEQIEQVAQGEWTVLIEGETGTGKELAARAIHALSPRRHQAFLTVNCAGLTDSLLATQLFGHVKGSFTGATHDKPGLFESAAGGTVFLDEIGDLSVSAQGALLRVLQEKEVTRVGESVPRKVDVRIITATNRDLRRRVVSGDFRADLLYRIRGARIRVPALRERREDIPVLTAAFLAEQREVTGTIADHVSEDAVAQMIAYDWPGNVRELRAAVEHLTMRSRGGRAERKHLPDELLEGGAPAPGSVPPADERSRIVEALMKTGGNRARAAMRIGVGRATLYRRMKQLGMERKTPDDA